jgi:PKD repeat protein
MLNPPTADFTASITTGCSPLTVSFVNNSQNTSSYEWDFGNGTVLNVNDTTAQNQTFDQSTQVQLVAFASPLCSDTMVVNINIAACGCTNPNATNYNPNAVLDDGSCI